jgi:tryptophan synthase alpha chain
MTRITSTFRRLGKAGEVAAIPYLPIGVPDAQTGRSLLPVIGRQGADLVAIGPLLALPGLDDLAAAGYAGGSLDDCMSIAAEARRTNEVPLILVSNSDAAQAYGLDRLARACASSGVDGLLIADLVPGEFASFAAICVGAGVDPIPAISASIEDLSLLASAGGFVYCAVGEPDDADVEILRANIASITDLPLVIGVAADNPDALPASLSLADGVLAGSGLVARLTSHPPDEIMLEVSDHVRAVKAAVSRSA